MKKYFYSVLAAGMLFACSQEDVVDVTKGEGQPVTIQVELPSIESRAIAEGVNVGEGNMVDKLVYAMYEEDQRTGEPLVANFADRQTDGTFKITVTMAKDIKYDLLFLAYNETNPAFVIDSENAKANNLNDLKLKTELSANQESYDAFVGMLDSHGIQDANTVTLTRPFAQVNAVTTLNDLNAVKGLKSEVTTSKLVIKAPTTYNVFTGAATNEVELTYAASTIIEDKDATDYPKNEKFDTDYYYLTLAYVLAGATPDAPSSNHNAEFEFYRADGICVSKLDIASLPLQRNYRTNVVGDLLTKSEDYTVTIQPGFDGSHVVDPNEGQLEFTDVTPGQLNGITIESNKNYRLQGNFNNENVSLVMAKGVENVVFDGSSATNINELIITQDGQLIDHANDIVGERSGKVTIQKFNVHSQINVFACKTEVVVQENTAEALMVHAGNCDVKVLNNVIDANFESHPTYKNATSTWNTNDYGIALNIFDYNLWLDGNTVTDATSHAIGINGWEGTFDTGDENKIESFVGNKITVNSTTKTNRAALKIWDDETYASNDKATDKVNATAQAFINAVLQDGSNTFNITGNQGHTIFCFYNVNTNN